jgi:GT2 family glycosyltransferase
MANVTLILLNYKRPDYMRRILSCLRDQTEPVETLLINNGEDGESFGADREVYIPWNAKPFIRFPFALYADTEWVMFLDDDLIPMDNEFVHDALAIAQWHGSRNGIIGAFGRRFSRTAPHYAADALGDVEIIKGRFMLMRREELQRVRMPVYPEEFAVGLNDDIWVSLEIGGGRDYHWADSDLQDRLRNLPEGAEALSLRPHHMGEREAFCAWYMRHRL